jgi:hypothetical protein
MAVAGVLAGAALVSASPASAAPASGAPLHVAVPSAGSTVSGKIGVAVGGAKGTRRVSFAVDGRVRDVDTSRPFALGKSGKLDTRRLSNGVHRIRVRVAGRRGTTTVNRRFTVSNHRARSAAVRDRRPAVVSWKRPATGATISGVLDATGCEVAATDNVGVNRVEFYAGSVALNVDRTAPYNCTFDTRTVADGQYVLNAVAYDTAGNRSYATRTVTVSNKVDPAPPADTTAPTVSWAAPTAGSTLSGTISGNACTATAADGGGIARVDFSVDGTALTSDTTSPFECTFDTTKVADGNHVLKAVAYDKAGNSQASTVTVATRNTVTPAPTPTPATPAPFPSRLKANGRKIVDENGYVLPTLKGFNMHVGPGFTWPQQAFNDIAAKGGKINRAVIHWDQFEPSQGYIDPTAIANLDQHIARAQAAGIYTLLELHLNVGRTPAWVNGVAGEMERYGGYGQTITQYLANRYGNPSSPNYTKAVIGFGLNEPPLDDSNIRNGNNSIPYLEGKQRQMLSWIRTAGKAPSWIGFVAYGYAMGTPIYNDATQNAAAVDASPSAYDSVGGNVIIDIHDYIIGCNNTDANCDGRQWNGMSFPTYQGGPQIQTGDSPAPAYASSALRRSQHAAFFAPYKKFTEQAQIPLMVGEWGWQPASSGELDWINDAKSIWKDAGSVIEIQWNYDVTTNWGVNYWAARPGGNWTPSVSNWMS